MVAGGFCNLYMFILKMNGYSSNSCYNHCQVYLPSYIYAKNVDKTKVYK